MQEELLASCHDDLDRQIIAMRADGYTHEEIAEKCSMSQGHLFPTNQERLASDLVERCPEYRQYVRRGGKDD